MYSLSFLLHNPFKKLVRDTLFTSATKHFECSFLKRKAVDTGYKNHLDISSLRLFYSQAEPALHIPIQWVCLLGVLVCSTVPSFSSIVKLPYLMKNVAKCSFSKHVLIKKYMASSVNTNLLSFLYFLFVLVG